MSNIQPLLSSMTNEWYTPMHIIALARQVMGEIDLDPATTQQVNEERIQARHYFTIEDDALQHDWFGRVWLNPPYGRGPDPETGKQRSNQDIWSSYLIDQYDCGNVSEAILLVNAATGEQWFQKLWRFPIHFTRRIRFVNHAGKQRSPTHGNALVYLGPRPEVFIDVFSRWGITAQAAAQAPDIQVPAIDRDKITTAVRNFLQALEEMDDRDREAGITPRLGPDDHAAHAYTIGLLERMTRS